MGKRTAKTPGNVVDLFCGAGGLSYGFFQEGFNIVAGVDLDQACRYAFQENNQSAFYAKDIRNVTGAWLKSIKWGRPRVLAGCAPCQPFSIYNPKNKDSQWKLLQEFARLVEETLPDVVTMENVPALLKYRKGKVFGEFKAVLESCDYHIWHDVVFCPEYGVPQRRYRLILLASRRGAIKMVAPRCKAGNFPTVRSAIKALPRIAAGGVCRKDPLHKAALLSETNMKRIRQSKRGGSWRDWDESLVSKCHTRDTGRRFLSVYGRMEWDEPAPTITTYFHGFGNGRFGHPSQNRALSLREGALLQSFPEWYAFAEKGQTIRMKEVGRMIGNAVPPRLARAIAQSINHHLQGYPT
ncbi:MAG: DNA (cytosine-5-)-methyltransferase [Gammaproteobacteria bacterium]|nr:DNA (cytosine-5-)-methyltransferase [Gammaproteobacteria bacterium]